jgi:hypothetical protein
VGNKKKKEAKQEKLCTAVMAFIRRLHSPITNALLLLSQKTQKKTRKKSKRR